MSDDVTIDFNAEEHAFEAHIGGTRVGLLVDHLRRGRHLLVHTNVASEHGGKGIAGRLVQAAFDAARATGEQVVPVCPYVQHWLDEHPNERDIVDEQLTAEMTDDQ